MTTPRQKQIEALQARLARLQAEHRAAEARARAAASRATRAQDTRRKVLAGAYLLDLLGVDGVARLSLQGRRFGDWLARADERALFNLPPLAPPSPATASPHGSAVSAADIAPHASRSGA